MARPPIRRNVDFFGPIRRHKASVRRGVRVPFLDQDQKKRAITTTGEQEELEKDLLARNKALDAFSARFPKTTTQTVLDANNNRKVKITDYITLSSPNGTKFQVSVDDYGKMSLDLILISPNGSRYKIEVDNAGVLSTTLIPV